MTARRDYWAPSAKETAPVPIVVPEPKQVTALATLTVPARGRIADVWLGSARGSAEGRTSVTVAWEPAYGRPDGPAPRTVDVAPFDGAPRPVGTPLTALEPARSVAIGGSERFELTAGQAVVWRLTVRSGDAVLDQWDQKMTVDSAPSALRPHPHALVDHLEPLPAELGRAVRDLEDVGPILRSGIAMK